MYLHTVNYSYVDGALTINPSLSAEDAAKGNDEAGLALLLSAGSLGRRCPMLGLGGGAALGVRSGAPGGIRCRARFQVNKGGFPRVGRGLPGAVVFHFTGTDVDRSYLSAA